MANDLLSILGMSGGVADPHPEDNLLLETGDFLLLETGDAIILE